MPCDVIAFFPPSAGNAYRWQRAVSVGHFDKNAFVADASLGIDCEMQTEP